MDEDLQEDDMQEIVDFVKEKAGVHGEELTGLLFQVYYMEEELKSCSDEIQQLSHELDALL